MECCFATAIPRKQPVATGLQCAISRPSVTTPEEWSPSRTDPGVPQAYLAGLVDLRLLFKLSHRPDVRDPWLRGARPYLHLGDDLVALTNGAQSNGVNLGSCSTCRRIN